MAFRFTHRVRAALAIAALAAAGLAAPTIASATPGGAPHAKPSIADVQKRLGKLAMQNSQIVEKYNQSRIRVQKSQKAASAAKSAAAKANASYRTASVEFAQTVQAQYEAGSMGAAGALLDSESGPNYLDRLNTLNLLSSHDADVVSRVTSARAEARQKSREAQNALDAAKRQSKAVADRKSEVRKQIDKYQSVLNTLNAAQQRSYTNAKQPVFDQKKVKYNDKGGSANAQKAVQFALNQLGKPYVFGADGPGAYDCSGLTMRAWQHGGVSLPHSAAGQYGYGKHVSLDNLTPGDLVFMYPDIGHVTIYIGSGQMVSAPTEGEPVQVVSVDSYRSDIIGATHLG